VDCLRDKVVDGACEHAAQTDDDEEAGACDPPDLEAPDGIHAHPGRHSQFTGTEIPSGPSPPDRATEGKTETRILR
jgi:hypothetical protein